MFDKLQALEAQYEELTGKLAQPEIIAESARFLKLSKAFAELEPVVQKFREFKSVLKELAEAKAMLDSSSDEDLQALAREEMTALVAREATLDRELKAALLPRDPNDGKDVILEVRAGEGGDEAALFAAEVVRMYTRYADRVGWKAEWVDSSQTGRGGIKEAVLNIRGKNVYARLKYESGVHRVQRVPETEASGRIHTSAVTVAVLPEAEEVEVHIDEEKDLRIDRFCSSGPGGQSVNTTYSAVRITHIPTGLVVSCQDEKSQIKNRSKAMLVLRARLFEIKRREQDEARASERRSQVGAGGRSEKIRTYNFRENRVTDHRIGLTLHQLDLILDGALDTVFDSVIEHFNAEKLKQALEESTRPSAVA